MSDERQETARLVRAFADWVDELEQVILSFEKKSGWRPYDIPLAVSTGLACWREWYDDGMTPQEAFESDQSSDSAP
ncbi:MAG: hypothetical protein ACR2QC_00675 [Gammaproteobacteria bacterium]